MNVLAFDTCMEACSVALIRGGKERLYSRFALMERGHAEALFPMIEAVMSEAGFGFAELTAIAVTRGPGTFTGVRAGVAAARGLALGCGAPIIAATSLEVMALGCLGELGPRECSRGMLIAHDARRGELYIQAFDGEARALSEPVIAAPTDAARLAAKSGLVAGTGGALIAAEAGSLGLDIRAELPGLLPDARHLAALALRRAPAQAAVSRSICGRRTPSRKRTSNLRALDQQHWTLSLAPLGGDLAAIMAEVHRRCSRSPGARRICGASPKPRIATAWARASATNSPASS